MERSATLLNCADTHCKPTGRLSVAGLAKRFKCAEAQGSRPACGRRAVEGSEGRGDLGQESDVRAIHHNSDRLTVIERQALVVLK